MADGAVQSPNVVFNSLLCYVVTKLRTLELARIRSTVLDFYSAEDVSSAKKVLLEAVDYIQLDKPLPRYPERQGANRTTREMDDIMDIFVQIEERKQLNVLPNFVAVNSDNLPSPRMDVGEMHTIMNKIDKLEAILFGVQTAVYNVQSTVGRVVSAINQLQSAGSGVVSRTGQPASVISTGTTSIVQLNTTGNSAVSQQQQQQSSSSFTHPKTLWSDTVAQAEQQSASDTGLMAEDSADDFILSESRKQRRKKRRMQSGPQSTPPTAQPTGERPATTAQPAASSQLASRDTAAVNQARSSTSTTASNSFRRPLIVGKSYVSAVSAAKPYKSVYCVDNVSTSVDSDSLTSFVSSLGVRVLSCFEVKPRMTARQRLRHVQVNHKTFRLCINRADNNILLNADIWPSDVSVFRWFFKRSSEPEAGGGYAPPGEGMGSAADDRSQSGIETDMDATIVNYLGLQVSADETSADTVSLPS